MNILMVVTSHDQAADWQSFAVVDGRLITGQNPASSTAAAQALVHFLSEHPGPSLAS